jgi:CxxC motif-containing protein
MPMNKNLICIECPKGCELSVDIENCRVVNVTGNSCPKGKEYAASEIENPKRILTSAVLAQGLALKMIPVRTDSPIPKVKILEAMEEIKKVKINKPVSAGEVLVKDFLSLGVNLIATRQLEG